MTPALVEVVKNTNIVMVHRQSLLSFVFMAIAIPISLTAYAQVTVKAEAGVKSIMKQYTSVNAQTFMIRAWRIQAITTNDRSTMEEALEALKEMYPESNYKWEHNPPYYQVRLGAFEKKSDLEAFLVKLKEDFPAAIPVQDDIEKTEIIRYQ
ncbi:MAG: SPOR domain-containing protein [Chitinophagia bacterium]|jgi:hypothetical protein|nr:SPOR domain-containing protein [Chitinophagia bacterium]